MARRSQHTLEEIKSMVLAAAETLVVEQGTKALTMRNIALEIGYTVGSIYMVFANMSDLVLHLNARTLDAMVEQFERIPVGPPEQCIEEEAMRYLAFATRNFNLWSLLFEYRPQDGDELPDWYRARIERAFSRFEKEFERLAPEHTQAQARQAARTLWAGVHGVCMLALTGKLALAGADDVEDSVRLLVRRFIDGGRRQTDESAQCR